MTAHIFGVLLAAYFLVGRWSVGRIDGTIDSGSIAQEPRVWIVGLLVLMTMSLPTKSVVLGRRDRLAPVDVAICVFLMYSIFTGLWAPRADVISSKAFELFLMLIVALMILMARGALAHEKVELGFWWAIVLVGAAMAGLAILNATGGRVYVPSGGPNTFGRNMGLTALGAAYLASRYGATISPMSAAVMIVAAPLILMSGSRGALLSTTVGILTLLITARASLLTRFATACLITSAVAVLLFNTVTGTDALDVFQSRIVEATIYDQHLSSRDDLWLDAFDLAKERPWLGWGLNGYRANSWTYPHNIFLEVTVEGGCVGLVLLLNVGRAWVSRVRQSHHQVSRVSVAALTLTFTAAQTSGDLFDSRGVFLMLALSTPAIVLPNRAAIRQQPIAPQLPRRIRNTGTALATPNLIVRRTR